MERLFSRKEIVRLIWPLLIEMSLSISVGMADGIIVSHAGEAAMSGVSLVDMINTLLFEVFVALATGGTVVISQFMGAGRHERAQGSANQLMFVALVLSVLLSGVVLIFKNTILFGAYGDVEPDVMRHCQTYLSITALSYPFVAMQNASSAIFRCMGNSKTSMLVSLGMNAINLTGNLILVYGFHMGVAGVAIPTVIARATAAIVLCGLLCRSKNVIRFQFFKKFKPARQLIVRILCIGLPGSVENAMFQLGRILVISFVAGFGTAQISANAIANNLLGFGFILSEAVAVAIVTVVGRCAGAGRLDQINHYTKTFALIGLATNAVVCSLLLLSLPIFLNLYQASDLTRQYARTLLMISCLGGIPVWSPAFVVPGALRACNDVVFTSVVSVLSMWFFRVGMGYVLSVILDWGIAGVWTAMVIDWAVRALVYLIRFVRGRWKRHLPQLEGAAVST